MKLRTYFAAGQIHLKLVMPSFPAEKPPEEGSSLHLAAGQGPMHKLLTDLAVSQMHLHKLPGHFADGQTHLMLAYPSFAAGKITWRGVLGDFYRRPKRHKILHPTFFIGVLSPTIHQGTRARGARSKTDDNRPSPV